MLFVVDLAWGTEVTTCEPRHCAPGKRPKIGSTDRRGATIVRAYLDRECSPDPGHCQCLICKPGGGQDHGMRR